MSAATLDDRQYGAVQENREMDLEDILKLKDGVDCERDVEQAARLLMEKANGGSGEAARELGILYAYGSGVRQDDRTSTEYFRRGAELGDAKSMYRLFRNLSLGVGCAVNLDEADMWLKRAADSGYPAAAATWRKFAGSRTLSRDLKSAENENTIRERAASFSVQTISPSAVYDLTRITQAEDISVVDQNWEKTVAAKSLKLMILIYTLGGALCGALLRSVYVKQIDVFGSNALATNFNSATGFTLYMTVIGALLGLTFGLILSKLLNRVKESLILYFPILLLPFIIMALSSLIMSLVHGVVGLVLGLLQIVVYLVVGYTVFASSTNS